MAFSLLDSPDDVLLLILPSLSSADLYNMCLTHSTLRFLAEPFLYSGFEWTWTQDQAPPIVSLLYSILRCPQHGNYVRSAVLNGDTFERGPLHYKRPSPKIPAPEGAELGELVECISRLNVPYSKQWIEELRAGTMDAYVALLLSQLPGLRVLRLDKDFMRESKLVSMLIRSAVFREELGEGSHVPSFEHLQEVSALYYRPGVDIREYTDARNTNDVLPLFYLPSVERVTTLIDNPRTFSWPVAHPPNPSKLSSLDLTLMREGHLGQILSVAKGLRILRWDWFYRPDLEDRFVTDIIDLDQIGADVSHVRETLTELAISATVDKARADPEFPPLTVKGAHSVAFHQLHVLRKLQVPLPILMGGFAPSGSNAKRLVEALPRNIEELTITDGLYLQEEYEWQDVHLLDALSLWWLGEGWKRCTPQLKRFHLLLKLTAIGQWHPDMRQQLRDLGVQAGIQVKITKLRGK